MKRQNLKKKMEKETTNVFLIHLTAQKKKQKNKNVDLKIKY